MTLTECQSVESMRLDAIIQHKVGWQLDELHVYVDERGVTLSGHARTNLARVFAEVEAARLSGLPVVDNRIVVS